MAAKSIALHGAGGGEAGGAPPPNLTRAALELYEAKPAGGGSEPGAPIDRIPFQFNPKELSISKSAKWERSNARDAKTAGPPEFNGADPCKLTLELFFDATDTHGRQRRRPRRAAVLLLRADRRQPRQEEGLAPARRAALGRRSRASPAFVTSVQAKYTLFTAEGTPIRATCNVSLEEMPGDPLKQNPTSGGLTLTSVRTVVAGDSLASIAYREYGDPAMWRPLAAFNGIDDPLRLRLGSSVLLPAVDDLMAGV